MRMRFFCACAAGFGFFILSVIEAAPLYSVTNLGALPSPNNYSLGVSIANDSSVTGHSGKTGPYPEAFIWSSSTGMVGLGDFAGGVEQSLGSGINANGHVVGSGSVEKVDAADSGIRAFAWISGTMQNLGRPAGSQGSFAYAINSSDQVVGHSFNSSGDVHHAFLWTSAQGFSDLGDLSGGKNYVVAYDINDDGVAVGVSEAAAGGDRAFRWTAGDGMKKLDDLSPTAGDSWAQGINQLGYAAGASVVANIQHAVMWNPAGQVSDLGALLGSAAESGANAINNFGQVVGNSEIGDEEYHAFVWRADDGMRDLNDLLDSSGAGWRLDFASDINDLGQIVGQGIYCASPTDCVQRAYLLTPVPEPAVVLCVFPLGTLLASRSTTRRPHGNAPEI